MGYIEDLRKLVGHRPLILVGSVVIIENEEGKILLQKRNESQGRWGLPGGLMELGESVEDTAIREVKEETGLKVDSLHLIGVYSGPEHFSIAENGDQFYVVVSCFSTQHFSGNLEIAREETVDLKFFELSKLPTPFVESHKKMINDFKKGELLKIKYKE